MREGGGIKKEKEKKRNIFLQCGNACNAPKARLTVRLVTRGSCNAYDGDVLFVSSCKLVPAGEVALLDRDLSNLISYCRITPLLFAIVVSYAIRAIITGEDRRLTPEIRPNLLTCRVMFYPTHLVAKSEYTCDRIRN